jgi:hypothetical protein
MLSHLPRPEAASFPSASSVQCLRAALAAFPANYYASRVALQGGWGTNARRLASTIDMLGFAGSMTASSKWAIVTARSSLQPDNG